METADLMMQCLRDLKLQPESALTATFFLFFKVFFKILFFLFLWSFAGLNSQQVKTAQLILWLRNPN